MGKMPRPARAFLQSLAGSSEMLDAEKVVRSIPEKWFDPALRGHVAGLAVIRPAGVEGYPFAEGFPPAFRREMHFARRHVYDLQYVTVNVRTGACVAGSLYFQESYGSLRRCLLEKPFPVSAGHSLADSEAVTCVNAASYYHFLLEEVPRLLWALNCHKGLSVLVHVSAPAYVVTILEKICAHHSVKLRIVQDEAIQASRYVFTQAEAYSGFVNSSDIELLRQQFAGHGGAASSGDKVYVSRQGVTRSFDNEAEIASFLRESGFQVCAPEKLSFEAQIELFRNAAVIVAPHGAGLSNLLWCRPGTRVLEIFSARHFNDCYARLSSQLKLPYAPLWSRETKGWGEVSLDQLAAFVAGGDPAGTFPGSGSAPASTPCR